LGRQVKRRGSAVSFCINLCTLPNKKGGNVRATILGSKVKRGKLTPTLLIHELRIGRDESTGFVKVTTLNGGFEPTVIRGVLAGWPECASTSDE
jgi:hypothetical protein